MRTRTKARQRAVESLFEAEQRSVKSSEIFERNPDVNDYAIELAYLVETNIDRIDEVISTYSQDWPLERMPAVDRAIVRVAIAELLLMPEIDSGVAVSEAVEIAATLSTPESGKFINGLLGQIATIRGSLTAL
ncbi:MAG: transcription antitermination factor NusB [Actinobacteria bacterium]|nr:transcription antitermination factor NusB [Actinomycetota bacterium]NBO34727.1 transcription antitermination factor NusB [Actinomycetota bacterium]